MNVPLRAALQGFLIAGELPGLNWVESGGVVGSMGVCEHVHLMSSHWIGVCACVCVVCSVCVHACMYACVRVCVCACGSVFVCQEGSGKKRDGCSFN